MQVGEARRYRQPWLGAATRDIRARHVFHSSICRSSPWVIGYLAAQSELRLVFDFGTPASLRSLTLLQTVSGAVASRPDHAEASTVASLHAPLCTSA